MHKKYSDCASEDFELLERGREYNRLIGHYETVNKNERYYRGDQWDSGTANDLPKPVFNLFKRIINFYLSSIQSQRLCLNISAEGVKYLFDSEERKRIDDACRTVSSYLNYRMDRDNIRGLLSDGLLGAAISGDMAMYVYWDENKTTAQGYKGDFATMLIDSTDIFFGDVNTPEVEDQPYILLSGRELTERLRTEAAENGATKDELEKIIPDDDNNYCSGDYGSKELDSTKSEYVIKLFRKNGTVHFRKSVRGAVICPETDTGLRYYPVAFMNWDRVKNSYHGQAVATGLTPNQNYINRAFGMVMKHMIDMSFSKVMYNSNIIDDWTNAVGEAIAVAGPVENAAKVIGPGSLQSGYLDVINLTIAFTKELMGATDAALGNVRPDNTSAIVALQQASNLPLENQKRGIRRFFEKLGLIWLDFMLCYYDSSRLLFFRENDQPRAELLGLTGICNTLFQCNVEVGESAYWSEIACVSTLDNLLAKGAITLTQYLERLPDGYIPKKAELISEIKKAAENG